MNKFLIIVVVALVFGVQNVNADTSFLFDVIEGQSGANNEFYNDRCVRADILLDTDGNDTGGADLEINYDNTRIAIVNNDCNTAASTIYHDAQYDNYVNNNVTGNKITLGAYNGPGNAYNGSGRFSSFYFTVLDGLGDYDLDFEFTFENTTDTNLAEYGTGNDILDHADSYTLHFTDDNDDPTIINLSPNNGDASVSVISNITFRLNDYNAGININTLNIDLTGTNWGTTNYTAASGELTYNCHTTNANRVDYCDITINPSSNLYYCETYTVDVTVSDLGNPTVYTLLNYIYTFDSEVDDDSPEIYNRNPNNGDNGVGASANVDFNIRDIANPGGYPGTGVDISTLSVEVSAPSWGSFTYDTSSSELLSNPMNVNDYGNVYNYSININPADNFPENTLVTVAVIADDYGCSGINSSNNVYTFTTADTIAPVCTLFTPDPHAVNMGTQDSITFHCTDNGVGVDINSAHFIANGLVYTATGSNQFSYTGGPSDYFVTIDPIDDFNINYALDVILNIADLANNHADQISYGLATGVDGTCQICDACEECDDCDDCKDEKECDEKVEVITKYETCDAIEKIIKEDKVIEILQAGSEISNTQLQNVTLTTINESPVGDNSMVAIVVRDDVVIFEGDATPNSKVTLMIESDPIIVTGLSNDEGKWRIEMANIFPNGIHEVSAVTVSKDDYIVKTKYLSNFEIKRNAANCPLWCCAIILILSCIIIVLLYKYRRNRKSEKLKKIS